MYEVVMALIGVLQDPDVSFVPVSRRVAGLISRCFPAETRALWGATKHLTERRVASLPTGALLIRTKKDGHSVFYLKCNHYDNMDARRTLKRAAELSR
jgi:hypothetical protein